MIKMPGRFWVSDIFLHGNSRSRRYFKATVASTIISVPFLGLILCMFRYALAMRDQTTSYKISKQADHIRCVITTCQNSRSFQAWLVTYITALLVKQLSHCPMLSFVVFQVLKRKLKHVQPNTTENKLLRFWSVKAIALDNILAKISYYDGIFFLEWNAICGFDSVVSNMPL